MIVARCLSRNPASRYSSAVELADALARLEGGAAYLVREGKKRAAALRAHVAPRARLGWKWLAAPAVALMLALAAGGYFLSGAGGGDKPEPPPPPDAARMVKTMIDVNEGKAVVFVNEKRLGETPYTISNNEGTMIHLRLTQEGYEDVEKDFRVEKLNRSFKIPMKKK